MQQVLSPEISLIQDEHTLTLRLQGVVGVLCATELLQGAAALVAHEGGVALDTAGLEHLDTAAAQVLLALGDALDQTGRPLRAPGLPPGPRKYLALAGLALPGRPS